MAAVLVQRSCCCGWVVGGHIWKNLRCCQTCHSTRPSLAKRCHQGRLEQRVERGEIHGCTSHGLWIWKGRCIFILDIKGDSFTVESLKKRVPGVVNKHELANLFTVNTVLGLNQRWINLTSEEMDEEHWIGHDGVQLWPAQESNSSAWGHSTDSH